MDCSKFGYNCIECDDMKCNKCKTNYGIETNAFSLKFLQCIPCKNYKCVNCSTDANKCDACEENYFVDIDEDSPTFKKCIPCGFNCSNCLNENICIDCVDGYGLDENGKCVECTEPNCSKCNQLYSKCDECKTGFGIDTRQDSNTYGKCIQCLNDCFKCNSSNASICTQCPIGYGGDVNNCFKCDDPNCIDCNSDSHVCKKCNDFYQLKKDKCLLNPIENCLFMDGSICHRCDTGYFNDYTRCVKINDTNCEKFYSYYHSDVICEKCKNGYGLNDKKICTRCKDPNCQNCHYNYSVCKTCNPRFYMNKNTSVCSKCQVDYCKKCGEYNDVCIECQDNYGFDYKRCKQCEDSNCIECKSDYQKCQMCKPGYCLIPDDRCIPCVETPNCLTYNDYYECSKCKANYYLNANKRCSKCTFDNCYFCRSNYDKCEYCLNGYGYDFTKGSIYYEQCVQCQVENCKKMILEFVINSIMLGKRT